MNNFHVQRVLFVLLFLCLSIFPRICLIIRENPLVITCFIILNSSFDGYVLSFDQAGFADFIWAGGTLNMFG